MIGGVALMAFAIIFFRLWYLQVLSGDRYLAEASDNRVREIKVQAPRGEIVDRNGTALVVNRSGLALVVSPDKVAEDRSERREVYERLGKLLRMKPDRIERRAERDMNAVPFSAATIKSDVPDPVAAYVLGARIASPGSRSSGSSCADIRTARSARTCSAPSARSARSGSPTSATTAWSSAIASGRPASRPSTTASYAAATAPRGGEVDALGNISERLKQRLPPQGRQLRLSVDLDVQRAGQEALSGGTGKGAFAVMDVNSGEVVALGSTPSFDANRFTKDYQALSKDENDPLTNRAIQGGYPTGSTFKLVTAVAGDGERRDRTRHDPQRLGLDHRGRRDLQERGRRRETDRSPRGALTVSSDVFFYQLGQQLSPKDDGLGLQRWARRLSVGRKTGIDLPEELRGRIPTPAWRNHGFKQYQRCVKRRSPA